MATLGRIRSFAPTAAKLADSKGEYLSVIKARRQEEAAARKEREVRVPSRCKPVMPSKHRSVRGPTISPSSKSNSHTQHARLQATLKCIPCPQLYQQQVYAWLCLDMQGRRRRMLVEQQAARSAAEGRVEADCLLEVLVRRSAEEQKLAQHLWQLQQEKVNQRFKLQR
jgi:hypothetical protein